VVCEALANTAKHARATAAEVAVAAGEGVLRVRVSDDGRGGACLDAGSGLVGLRDRVEALGGRITLHSPPGAGTALEVHIPLEHGGSPARGEGYRGAAGTPQPRSGRAPRVRSERSLLFSGTAG
jgi:signal transduction histidine kinase